MSNLENGDSGQNGTFPAGRKPPADKEFYLQWGRENAKESLKNVNAALAQLLTLSTALLGGAIAFWDKLQIDLIYRFAVLVVLLFTVLICLISAMPSEGIVDLKSDSDIRSYMEHVFAYKSGRLTIAKWSLFLALAVMVLGLMLKILYT